MTNPLDPTELLAAAKPTSRYVVEPARLDAMIAHAIAAPAPLRFALLRSWKMRAGSALAAMALATTAIVISLSGAPAGLTVLAFSPSTKVVGPSATTSIVALPQSVTAEQGTFGAVASAPPINFIAGKSLTTKARSLPVFTITSTADPSSDVKELASVLGVSSDAISESCARGVRGANTVSSNEESKTAVVYATTLSTRQGKCQSFSGAPYGPVTWSYKLRNAKCSLPSNPASTTLNACLVREVLSKHAASSQKLIGWSTAIMESLQHNGVAPQGLSIAKPTVLSGTNIVKIPITTVGGVASNQYEQFWFTNHGVLIYASGLIGAISLNKPYPALSEVAGVQLLHAGGVHGTGAINPGGPMIPATTTTVVTSGTGFKATVTLNRVSLSYELVWLTNGTAVFVPQYTYRASNGDSREVLALDPTYYHVQSTK